MKALIVCTSHSTFPTKSAKTGVWFSEIVHFYNVLVRQRILIDFVSPQGGIIPIDERSLDSRDELVQEYLQKPDFMKLLKNAMSPSEVDYRDYRVVYFAGGHGAIWDFPENEELQSLVRDMYESNRMITAVGQGVSALVNVKLSDGSYLLEDKYVTALSNVEEKLVSFICEVPFYLEDALIEKKANYTKALLPYTEHIEMDERLITAQNPNSARKLAQKLTEELYEK